jgi:DNA excision repair protein ERCC-2
MRVHCKLLEPSLVTAPILDSTWSTLVMSGTLHPPEMFADLLGIANRCAVRHYRSPFPPENKVVLGVAGVSSRFRMRGERMFDAFAQKIEESCGATPGNLAVFFPSYDFMNSVVFHLRKRHLQKRILVESREMNKNERDAVIADLKREGETVLLATLGGSFAEGIDFRDNLLSAVVVAGFPIAPPSVEGDAHRARIATKFGERKAAAYAQTYPAITKVLQAAGRAIRSETDRAAIVLLDERYLLPSVKECMPEDLRPEGCGDLSSSLSSFFAARRQADERVI